MKYFVVYRYRNYIDTNYLKEFLDKEKDLKFYGSHEKASKALHEGFYDDCDYDVFSIDEKKKIKRCPYV